MERHKDIGQINGVSYKRIEEMSLNGWPALQTLLLDGWLLRFADGYTKRSNSVSALYGHTLELDGKIRACEQIYAQKGLRTIFKITPFCRPDVLDAELEARGYELIDRSLVKTLRLAHAQSPDGGGDIRLEGKLTEKWLDACSMFSRLTDEQKDVTRKMMNQSPLEKGFAVLHENGIPVACGIAVIENGWIGLYDIVTDPSKRNQGFGRQLVLHLLGWGKARGARDAYLLVVKDNAPACRLYDKIGYKTAYEYWYRAAVPQHRAEGAQA